jgi:hypothetical protein
MSKPTDSPSKPSSDQLTTSAGNPVAEKCDPAYGAGVAKAVKPEPSGDDRLKGTNAT